MPDTEVRIADLEAHCTYYIGFYDTRNSSTCDRAATSIVLVPDASRISGKPKFRCGEHEGMLSDDERGQVVYAMPKSLADALVLPKR